MIARPLWLEMTATRHAVCEIHCEHGQHCALAGEKCNVHAFYRPALSFTAIFAASLFTVVLCAAFPAAAAESLELTGLLPSGGQRGTATTVKAFGSFPQWPPRIWCSSPHLQVTPDSSPGLLSVHVDAGTPPGPHWIRLYDGQTASQLRPFLVGSAPECAESGDGSEVLTLPRIINGRLAERGEVDQFRVHLDAGQTLVAAIDADRHLGSPMDAVLQLFSVNRQVVVQQDDDSLGIDPRIVYHADQSGDYVIRLFAFPRIPTSTIGFAGGDDFVYRLALSNSGTIDHAFPLAVNSSQVNQLQLVGWNLPQVPVDHLLQERPAGTVVQAFSSHAVGWFDCILTERPSLWETTDFSAEEPLVCLVPATISGYIGHPGDVDSIRFTGHKGESVRLSVESQELGFWLDPAIQVVDAEGETLVRQDDRRGSRDCQVVAKLPRDGMYTTTVRDLHGRGGERFAYRLTIEPAIPECRLTVATDRFSGPAGQAIEVPVTISCDADFHGQVELRAIADDPQVACVTVTANPGAKGTEVKLDLSADRPIATGMRIVGAVEGSATPLPCTAETGVSGFPTADLWVTFH